MTGDAVQAAINLAAFLDAWPHASDCIIALSPSSAADIHVELTVSDLRALLADRQQLQQQALEAQAAHKIARRHHVAMEAAAGALEAERDEAREQLAVALAALSRETADHIGHRSYRIAWIDDEYVATVDGMPSLSWISPAPDEALAGLLKILDDDDLPNPRAIPAPQSDTWPPAARAEITRLRAAVADLLRQRADQERHIIRLRDERAGHETVCRARQRRATQAECERDRLREEGEQARAEHADTIADLLRTRAEHQALCSAVAAFLVRVNCLSAALDDAGDDEAARREVLRGLWDAGLEVQGLM